MSNRRSARGPGRGEGAWQIGVAWISQSGKGLRGRLASAGFGMVLRVAARVPGGTSDVGAEGNSRRYTGDRKTNFRGRKSNDRAASFSPAACQGPGIVLEIACASATHDVMNEPPRGVAVAAKRVKP